MEHTGSGDLGTTRMDVDQWSDHTSRETLQQLADSVTETVGFAVAVVNVIRGDTMTTVTVSSDRPEIADRLLGARTPTTLILDELERAERCGRFRFVPQERVQLDIPAWGWRSDVRPRDLPDSWQPDDLFFAPLHSEEGGLIGLLSTDSPLDGLRPGPATRELLDRYAEQAEHAVRAAIDRDQHAQQERLTETARRLVRAASSQPTLERVLEESREPLLLGFGSIGTWIQVFDVHGTEAGEGILADGSILTIPGQMVLISQRAAKKLWDIQKAAVIGVDTTNNSFLSPDDHEAVTAFMSDLNIASVMFVPLGAGGDTFGILVLARRPEDPRWTRLETTSVLDIGRDLGAAILNARAFETKSQLIEDLQSLDAYKSQLIATVSHELKNPLTAIMGHLELLSTLDDLPSATQASVAAMDRGAHRLTGLVDDLLLLARVDSGAHRTLTSVDLGQLASRAVDRLVREEDAPTVRLLAPGGVIVQGNHDELKRLVAALLDNAARYGGGRVEVTLRSWGKDIVLEVTDHGIGIAVEEQGLIFNEFFRSADPVVTDIMGSGLGLSIAGRIAERHGGRIDVVSTPGSGSTFTLTLPREDPVSAPSPFPTRARLRPAGSPSFAGSR